MTKACKFVLVVIAGTILPSCTLFAQMPQSQPSSEDHSPAVQSLQNSAAIPVDQQPTKEQLAKLFEVMRLKEQMASMTKMMPAMMQSQMKQMEKDYPGMPPMSDEKLQAATKIMEHFMERAANLYTTDEMISDMSDLYQKHLSYSDVDGIIAFYSSPAGEHLLDMSPVIAKELMPTIMLKSQERIKPLMEEMSNAMKAVTNSSTQEKPIAK